MANANAKTLADDVLSWIKGTAFPAAPANPYVALLTAVPTKNDGTGLTEVSGSSYARQAVASSAWSAISQNADTIHDQISNSNASLAEFGALTLGSASLIGLALLSATGHIIQQQSAPPPPPPDGLALSASSVPSGVAAVLTAIGPGGASASLSGVGVPSGVGVGE